MRHCIRTVFALGLVSAANGVYAQDTSATDWSGPYVGGHVSGTVGLATTNSATTDGFVGSYFTSPDPEQIADETHGVIQKARPSIGIFGGFGQQWGDLYLGAESGISSLGFSGQRSVGAAFTSTSNPVGRFTNTISVEADWQATLRARLGLAHEHWLGYVTAGAAVSQLSFEATYSDDYVMGGFGSVSGQETRIGLALGVGGELDLGDGWALRADYLYSDFGKVEASSVVTNATYPGLANTLDNSVHFRTHSISVGLSFRF